MSSRFAGRHRQKAGKTQCRQFTVFATRWHETQIMRTKIKLTAHYQRYIKKKKLH